MNTLARANTRNTVLIAIAAVILALAGWRFSCATDDLSKIPTDESTWIYFVCEACDAYFHLDGREVERALRNGDVASSGKGGTTTFRCKECSELRSVRARKCPDHAVVIKLNAGPDEPSKCPECGFRP